MDSPQQPATTLAWRQLRQAEAHAGETRVNLVRLAALAAFYAHHLVQYYLLGGAAETTFAVHLRVTAIVFAWVGLGVLIHYALQLRPASSAIQYGSTLGDLILTTALVAVMGGPRCAFIGLYLVIVAAAPLRFSLPLTSITTTGAIAGYLASVGYYAWYQVGWERYSSDPAVRIPRTDEVIFLLLLSTAGMLAGQMVRQTRRTVQAIVAPRLGNPER